MVQNNKGFFIPNMTTITLILAVVGFWYLHNAYTNGQLKGDLKQMVTDGQKIVGPSLSSQQFGGADGNRSHVAEQWGFLQKMIRKIPTHSTQPLSTAAPAPASGAYYE
ncbi:MAG: hypothetical protein FPO08_00600 [Geobacter sp.]|nr:MAG: hypothetical protein FPO08_00600 [Geobacter sp.]